MIYKVNLTLNTGYKLQKKVKKKGEEKGATPKFGSDEDTSCMTWSHGNKKGYNILFN